MKSLPRLVLMEGAVEWGEARLLPNPSDNTIVLELRRHGADVWKPLIACTVIDDRIVYRHFGEARGGILAYNYTTGTLQDVVGPREVGDSAAVQQSQTRKDDDRGGDNT